MNGIEAAPAGVQGRVQCSPRCITASNIHEVNKRKNKVRTQLIAATPNVTKEGFRNSFGTAGFKEMPERKGHTARSQGEPWLSRPLVSEIWSKKGKRKEGMGRKGEGEREKKGEIVQLEQAYP